MEENKNSDSIGNSNSLENTNNRSGSSNLRNGSSNSNSRPGTSNSNPRPGTSNSNPRPGTSNSNPRFNSSNSLHRASTSNNWQERYQKPPKKRPHSENHDWGREKLNKSENPDNVKVEDNCENGAAVERASESSNDNSLMGIQEAAFASQEMAAASMAQAQQQMAVTMPQQAHQQIMHPQAMSYQIYSYGGTENYHIDPNQGAYMNPYSSMMPMNSQWPVNHAVANGVNPTPGISMSMEMVPSSLPNINGFQHMNMANNDPSMWNPMVPMFTPIPVLNNPDAIIPIFNNLEPLIINHAVLTPPPPGEKRTRRQKPQGCRTIFVGNLPEKITEEIIREAFKICGPISVVRMSKKNFCHIRFVNMESVDQALLLSGFRIRIDENEDPAFNGRLHVDYAVARDDQHEYKCLERAKQREERHRQLEAFRPPSPPPIPHFSEHESQSLAERLRNEETFREGLQVLITWLDRGECNKRNAGNFYSLIQSSYSHVKRLRNEKSRHKEEVEKASESLMNKNRAIELEINEIEKVFVAAKTQKVWDHFTRSQRKKMEEMKNDTNDLKRTNSEDLVIKREEEEMEFSDNEDRNDNEDDMKQEIAVEELNTMREKLTSLTDELDASNQALEDFKVNSVEQQEEIARLRFELEESRKLQISGNNSPVCSERQFCDRATQCSPCRVDATVNEQELISLVSIFLQVHPFGASIDYICSYLVKILPTINARDVESLMRRFPNLFKEVSTGIGATLEKKWTYVVFGPGN